MNEKPGLVVAVFHDAKRPMRLLGDYVTLGAKAALMFLREADRLLVQIEEESAAMRFSSLRVRNFKAIQRFEIDNLTDFVLIAGPNGCGKSCVLDAIRLLKSVYGGYQQNEWLQWFGEFQIDLNDPEQVQRLFRDREQSIQMAATVQLGDSEKNYLMANAEEIVEPMAWANVTGYPIDVPTFSPAIATQFRQFGELVRQRIPALAQEFVESLSVDSYDLALTITPDGKLWPQPNQALEIVFQTYRPNDLGVIEYHSAARSYQREMIGGVNLDVKQLDSERKQHTLYNWQNKYSNVKTELAGTYIRELVSKASGVESSRNDLNETLRELFQIFFPEKEYLGVQPAPNGGLSFPVRTGGGQLHDINELSSGEKEVLYGYLRLRNSTPKHSTILLDEPELHLNPALLRGFPDFYHKHLGRARSNQLWLVTHSDALLRQAVGNPNYSVFHMTSVNLDDSDGNQAREIIASDELEQATIDLVGDLAGYQPRGKVVLFEGGGETDIDVFITQKLFPEFSKRVNLISGGSKRRVQDLYEVLSGTAEKAGIGKRFYVVTDKDSNVYEVPPAGTQQLNWDVYHIENYLLVPSFVREAVQVLTTKDRFDSDDAVLDCLRIAACKLLPGLVMERLRKFVNERIVRTVDLGGDPKSNDPVGALLPAVEATFARLDRTQSELNEDVLRLQASDIESTLQQALAGDGWLSEFPGRLILKRFCADEKMRGVSYEALRNVIVDQMVDAGYQPAGMAYVIDRIQSNEDTDS
ncbi:hypothetical protein MFTT_38130 [Mycolicibacterium fortuitum subsp. fortuitum]|nr:hypothetical protein MFTT_38130 [Mycolicibacterium fortuitum subsp. fortuitum]